MILGSYDDAWHTKHNGTSSVTVSRILMKVSALVTFDKLKFNGGKWASLVVYIQNFHTGVTSYGKVDQ